MRIVDRYSRSAQHHAFDGEDFALDSSPPQDRAQRLRDVAVDMM